MANVKAGEKCAVTSHNSEIKGGQMPLSGQHLKKGQFFPVYMQDGRNKKNRNYM